ncbi:MAG: hypothetical protein WBB28_24390 [Crinalium sp.]
MTKLENENNNDNGNGSNHNLVPTLESQTLNRIKIQRTLLTDLGDIDSILLRLQTLHNYWQTEAVTTGELDLVSQLDAAVGCAIALQACIQHIKEGGYKFLLKTAIEQLEKQTDPNLEQESNRIEESNSILDWQFKVSSV